MSAILSAAQPHILENSMFYRRLLSILQPKSRVMVRLACAALLIGASPVLAAPDAPPREDAPAMTSPLVDENGAGFAMADLGEGPVLVNFWATWCAPCLKELPSLDMLEADLGGRKFEVVAIAADPRGPEVARQFLDRLGIEHLKLYADPDLKFAFAIGGADILPVSILYDAKGQEVGRLVGEADWSAPEARRLIESALP